MGAFDALSFFLALTFSAGVWAWNVPLLRRTRAAHNLHATVDVSLPELSLFNSQSRKKEAFAPLTPGKVSMYTCGPTVYDYAHVGNFRAFLTYDLIKRALRYFGYEVVHVCNITDVDDKIINRANQDGIQVITDLTIKFENLFLDDLKALNIDPADKYPRATEHVPEMMELILQLADKGLAYETADGSWYFATDRKEGYGEQLVQINPEEMDVTERGDNELKRNSQDFCLWKAFKPEQDRNDAAWESPEIKKGRPGWHLECSAMARKYLGDTIDIHGGGIDLKFPHHENEIAQSEGATGAKFCNCWMHNGFVNINDEKMSKSLGNFMTLQTACSSPEQIRAYRYLVITSQYRNPLNFTPEVMSSAQKSLKRIDKVFQQLRSATAAPLDEEAESILAEKVVPNSLANFEAALLDDLNMPRATAALFGLIKEAEKEFKASRQDGKELDVRGLKAVADAMLTMDKIFGVFYTVPGSTERDSENEIEKIPEGVLELVRQRSDAKSRQDWGLADELRDAIREEGFNVKDVKGGDPVISKI